MINLPWGEYGGGRKKPRNPKTLVPQKNPCREEVRGPAEHQVGEELNDGEGSLADGVEKVEVHGPLGLALDVRHVRLALSVGTVCVCAVCALSPQPTS